MITLSVLAARATGGSYLDGGSFWENVFLGIFMRHETSFKAFLGTCIAILRKNMGVRHILMEVMHDVGVLKTNHGGSFHR